MLDAGTPRSSLVTSFAFGDERAMLLDGLLARVDVPADLKWINDAYRGLIGRLPDVAGLNAWLQWLRTAQCAGVDAVRAAVVDLARAFIDSEEQRLQMRTDARFIQGLYDSFLRRGAAQSEIQYWADLLNAGWARLDLVDYFAGSAEFQVRIEEIVAIGCTP